MHTAEHTASAPTEEQVTAVADNIIRNETATVTTISDLQRQATFLITTYGDTGAIGERMKEYNDALTTVTAEGNHGNVQLQPTIASDPQILGQNTMGQHNETIVSGLVDPEMIIEDTRRGTNKALEVVKHEHRHSLQDPAALPHMTVVMDGELIDATSIVEGSTVVETASELGESIPDDLPEKTYGEGVEAVQTIGTDVVKSHLEKGGADVGSSLQTTLWLKRSEHEGITFSEMAEDGSKLGMTIGEIRGEAAKIGVLENVPEQKTTVQS